jgi:5'-3' exonuclease
MEGDSPVEKNGEKERRKQQRDLQKQRLDQLKNDFAEFESTNNISELLKQTWKDHKDGQNDSEQIVRFLHFQDKVSSGSDENKLDSLLQHSIDNGSFQKYIQEQIKKKEDQIISVTEHDFQNVKQLCTTFGIPVWQSDNEAETLCCKMSDNTNFQQISIGVISEDTDVLAYGCNMLICDLNTSSGECNIIFLPSLLEAMSLTYSQFLHFCIMCGCDYNQNIPGISSVKCYEWIRKHNDINTIFQVEMETIKKKTTNDESIQDIQNKMKRSIEMFSIEKQNIDQTSNLYWNRNFDINSISEFFLKFHIYNEDQFSVLWNNKIKLKH